MFGYHANATKIWFITKDPHLAKARVLSQDTQVNITSQGRPHLGTALGSQGFVDQYVTDKVLQWNKELLLFVDVSKIQPHTAYTAFIHGYIHKFSYLSRTIIPSIDRLLQPLEDCICSQLIPALTGRAPPPLSCLSLEVSETLPRFATRGSPRCYPPNGTSPTAVLSPGSDVACCFPPMLFNAVHKRCLLYQHSCFQPTHSTN